MQTCRLWCVMMLSFGFVTIVSVVDTAVTVLLKEHVGLEGT